MSNERLTNAQLLAVSRLRPAIRATPWQFTPTDGSTRWIDCRVRWFPGWDCRVECWHERKGDHGQHGDELSLEVKYDRGDQRPVAVSLRVSVQVRAGQVLEELSDLRNWPLFPVCVATHFGFPVTPEQLKQSEPAFCDVLPNEQCWDGGASCLDSERFWTARDTDEVRAILTAPDVEVRMLDHAGAVWMRLQQYLLTEIEQGQALYAALPRLCEHCGGSGFIQKEKGR